MKKGGCFNILIIDSIVKEMINQTNKKFPEFAQNEISGF